MGNLDHDTFILVLLVITFWSLPWKGVALWKAARLSHDTWFVILLVFQTLAILEIIYIFGVANKYSVETEDVGEIEEK